MDRSNTLSEMRKQLEKYKPMKFELDSMLKDIGLPASKGIDLEEYHLAANE